ncbi:MAG: 2-oxoglutarate dehydrogenase complex dihydrolipoyllysine-residue succinyltransferase [Rhodobacteraceae bacterium]|nr:2-oxoglutarate dehydrogenase complex dihydrolipoyllysine-residue succinyltransferase [Paracoccaceae bacterium]MYF47341.1 2-oxoglutarate dehydrogenase complex dihydrolipoyllysine-residue succinyltransferase [Paracoccaceae bacterium]MYI90345.1 2-oxoglutarate dehydrogenase complex dihydrolipoyllysine-residue succinyltransferase [Paracoccaceae bacterium]
MSIEIRVPTLGESITEATVGNWYKSTGDVVEQDEVVCDLDTEKVAIEVRAPKGGILSEIVADKGEDVSVDALLAMLSEGIPEGTSKPAPKETTVKDPEPQPEIQPQREKAPEDAPSAKRIMAEKGIDRDAVSGTGKDGRVMKQDVINLTDISSMKSQQPAVPVGELEERIPMSRLRQTIASRLKAAQNTAAILTTYNEVDMSEIMRLRQQYKEDFSQKFSIKLGFMSFFVKACSNALLEVPEVNGEIDGTDIVFRKYVNMGIAVGTPTGLVVPVIRNTQNMSFGDIELAIVDYGKKARDGKLTLDDMQGGTFSISNGGIYGSLMSSPILNPPQSGILGMHKIQDRPVVVDGKIEIRPMMYLALSYDHRIVDGKGAVTFLVRVKEALEDPRRMLLDI